MMRRLLVLAAGLAVFSAAACAQAANPLTSAFLDSYKNARLNLEQSAEVMPADGYDFRATPAVRTFGDWIGHTAQANYSFCSSIKGEVRPDLTKLHALKTREELSKALRESFEYCNAAFDGLDDQKALSSVTVGERHFARVQPMIGLIGSLNEHYGNIVVYLRLKGLVPPSTARAQQQHH